MLCKSSAIKVSEVKFESRGRFNFYSFYVGECKNVTKEMTYLSKEKTLSTILSNYELADTLNVDGFGCFYQELLQKILNLKKEKCSGGKQIKIMLKIMAASSITGVKFLMFFIQKGKTRRCFKGIKKPPCRYYKYCWKFWVKYWVRF